MQLISYYKEIKKVSIKLRYLCSTIFRTKEYRKIDIDSTLLHLGLFYDIVLSENSIFETYAMAYKGLKAYQNSNKHAKIILEQLDELQNENKKFGMVWQEKWRALSHLIEPFTSLTYFYYNIV